jgi:hypothetical protein
MQRVENGQFNSISFTSLEDGRFLINIFGQFGSQAIFFDSADFDRVIEAAVKTRDELKAGVKIVETQLST